MSDTPRSSEQNHSSELPELEREECRESVQEEKTLPHNEKTISLSKCVLACVALVLAAVMLTYTVCSSFYRKRIAEIQGQSILGGNLAGLNTSVDDSLNLFAALFSMYSVHDVEIDGRAIADAALREFVRQTGDPYAAYYTAEQFELLKKSNAGETQGIGITISESTALIGQTNATVIKIVNVVKNSPAYEAGLQVGDLIAYVGVGDARQSVNDLGYDPAIQALQGTKGTVAEFTIIRANETGGYTELPFSIMRKAYTNQLVYSHRCTVSGYEDVGIVKILQFDIPTPAQFREAMDELIKQGCRRFVFDVRDNPGGDLKSIEAVLSFFLQEGDVIIRTEDKLGTNETSVVKEIFYEKEYASCSVSKADIGKYRDYSLAVLCNENTASAAELFTAALRDYQLATLVGVKTFGKGSMQMTFDLSSLGCPGALKLTTKMYYPPLGDSYEGKGIDPHVTKELSEEATKKLQRLDLQDHEDDQLLEALTHIS